ncbi:MAG: hypothetical protein BWY50_00135 [Spirochaetes bacterium ADurb.Bin315]|nr:MAG: hypothetical protein BWY50_00135 [Spirochaetes bacterium ADurb.Bin315]
MDKDLLTELYTLAKATFAANLDGLFFEEDLFAVSLANRPTYYVTLGNGVLVANRGRKGLTNFLEYLEHEETEDELEFFEYQQAMDSLYSVVPFDEDDDMLETDETWRKESGVLFEDMAAPIFRSKVEYCLPGIIDEEEAKEFIRIFKATLHLIARLTEIKKEHPKHRAIAMWHDQVSDGSKKNEYIPRLTVGENEIVLDKLLFEPWNYENTFPVPEFADAEQRRYYKSMKAKSGKVFYMATGIFPAPVSSEKFDEPTFPVFYLLYDPQAHQILDVYMLDDYEKDHNIFIDRFLAVVDRGVKPQAIHCYGRRTLPLLTKIGPNMGVMVFEGKRDAELDEVIDDMLHHFLHDGIEEEDEHDR